MSMIKMLTMANMDRWQTQLCALGILAVLLPHCQVSGRICEPSNRTGPVFFTQVLNVAEYINYGASKPLLCCASGFHSIQWYILNGAAAWEPYPPDSSGTEQPNTVEDDQVLRIYHAMDFQNTKFRCDLIVDGSVVLNHTVRLYVSHCSTRAKGPMLIEPFPQNQTIYDYGGNISLYCTGDFGCYKHNDVQIVMWSVDIVGNNPSDVSDRYHLVTNESEDKTTLGVTLSIEKVESIDTTRTFICTIMNDQSVQGRTDRMVWITKKDRPESPTMKIVMAVCIPVGIFVTAFLVVLCMYMGYGPQVKLFVYLYCPCCRRKVLERKYEYHVFLYHADDDGEKAAKIKQKLEDKHYNVFISADIIAGTEFISETSANFEKSAAVHFLYTENLLHDKWALRFLTTLMEYGKDILCLEIDDFTPQHVISSIEEGPLETDGAVMNGIEIKSVSNDICFWKRLPKVKVPTEKDSQRKQKNFWCHLQNKLPKPRRETMVKAQAKFDDDNRRNSERPLLEESAPSTPMNFIGPHQEVSPTSDAVFEYDENLEDYPRNANMDYALRAEAYIHNEVQQQNPQPATIDDRILNQAKRQDFDHDIAMTHMPMNAWETENEQATIVADNQTHAHIAEDLQFIDPNWSSHDTDQHGNASHCETYNLIHPMHEEGFMYSGGESPPTNASMSSPSDCNDYLFRSGSYTGTSSGGYSAGISGQSDSGYSRSETSSSFVANIGTSQSLSPTSPSFNGLSSGELLSVTDSGEIKHVEVKKDGDKKALTLTIGPTGHTQNVSNTFVSPESGYSSTSEHRPFISITD